MKITYRKIDLDNCEAAIKIYDENHNIKTNIEKLKTQIVKLENNRDYYNMIALLDNEIVGMFTAIVCQDIVQDLNPFITVWNLGVSKKYRRKGIATEMLKYITNLARDLGCDFVALIAEAGNEAAINLYKKAQFQTETGFVKFITKD